MVSGQDMWSSSHSAETLEEKGWDGGKYQCLLENDGNWMIDITFNDIGDYWVSHCIPHAPKYIYIYIYIYIYTHIYIYIFFLPACSRDHRCGRCICWILRSPQILAVRAYVSAEKLTGHSFTTFDQISRHFCVVALRADNVHAQCFGYCLA